MRYSKVITILMILLITSTIYVIALASHDNQKYLPINNVEELLKIISTQDEYYTDEYDLLDYHITDDGYAFYVLLKSIKKQKEKLVHISNTNKSGYIISHEIIGKVDSKPVALYTSGGKYPVSALIIRNEVEVKKIIYFQDGQRFEITNLNNIIVSGTIEKLEVYDNNELLIYNE